MNATMTALEHTSVVELLGSYQGNLDERARLLGAVETDLVRRVENELALFRVEQRLYLYAALEREVARLIGAGDNERNRDD